MKKGYFVFIYGGKGKPEGLTGQFEKLSSLPCRSLKQASCLCELAAWRNNDNNEHLFCIVWYMLCWCFIYLLESSVRQVEL